MFMYNTINRNKGEKKKEEFVFYINVENFREFIESKLKGGMFLKIYIQTVLCIQMQF